MPLILFFGVGGNLINCAVFLQKTLRSSSYSVYLIASTVTHTILLILAMSTNLYSFGHTNPNTYSIAYCKLRNYFISSLFNMSRTYIVLASVDRYAICSPYANIRAFSRRQIALKLIPIVIGMWIFIPSHNVILSTIQNNQCIMPGLYKVLYAGYAVICAAIFLPSFTITFGLLARRNLRLMRRRIVPAGTIEGSRTFINKVDYQIMKMLFVDVTIYCITIFPFPITTVYGVITMNTIKSTDRAAIDNFLSLLAGSILQYLNVSSAMYSNFITSVAFREELKKLTMHCIRVGNR
ncbi:unnamed protein product [Adineta steineri]|uniref:G-protein coupled receptors family 1 profile domain-containing protein n=1 Tax=Adineta steineri TaxID=433720 RepID=A0A815B805_9BILA|nr:unnamed protein product [Adineta steineri]CAF1273497.1 unnamed protein product [Adineta steineri]